MAKPEDFLAQARKLLKSAGNDLDYRAVIGRAYYGAYHAALQFEEKLPHRSKAIPSNVGTHEALIQRLERPDAELDYGLNVISKEIAAQLRMLKPLRELADYELGESVHIDQAEQAVLTAEEIMAECVKGLQKLKARNSS